MNTLLELSWPGYFTRMSFGLTAIFIISYAVEYLVRRKTLHLSSHLGIAIGTTLVSVPAFFSMEFTILTLLAILLKTRYEARVRKTVLLNAQFSSECFKNIQKRQEWTVLEIFSALMSVIMTLVSGENVYPVFILGILGTLSFILLVGGFNTFNRESQTKEIIRLRSLM